jgi:hypothetical protein
MTPHEVLVAARELIADERNWIKGEYSRRVEGRLCYCAYGAVRTVSDAADYKVFDRAWNALESTVPDKHELSPIHFNDDLDTTHADILAMFDRAIEATAPTERVA